MTMSNDLRGSE